jgi:hypothetical protein
MSPLVVWPIKEYNENHYKIDTSFPGVSGGLPGHDFGKGEWQLHLWENRKDITRSVGEEQSLDRV